ncbi:MAG TPA: tetratricopeptide repeat protein [Gammaproteobacteria bacterium]|nr:tetratricopeptide repeat protein [Gammaproteobacteria bacterium]
MSDIEESLKNAKALLEAGKGEAARVMLLELLKKDANNTTALLMLGGAYFYEKKFAEAEMVYQRLVLAEPGSGMLSIALFNSLWNQGRHEEATEEIRRFILVADKVQERETLEKYVVISNNIAEQLDSNK